MTPFRILHELGLVSSDIAILKVTQPFLAYSIPAPYCPTFIQPQSSSLAARMIPTPRLTSRAKWRMHGWAPPATWCDTESTVFLYFIFFYFVYACVHVQAAQTVYMNI